jgi:Tetratricopeptide repeat
VKLPDESNKGTRMDCQKVEDEDIIERYLSNRLSEPETEAFEKHYLECQRCFGEVELRHSAAIELKARPIHLRSPQSRWTFWSWQWALGSAAVAALVLVGVFYFRSQQETTAPTQQIAAVQQPSAALLEQFSAVDQVPPYVPGVIRGGESSPAMAKFQEGMALYSMEKYSDAIPPLSEAVRLDPARPIFTFYLGISYLVSGTPDEAIAQLAKVAAQDNPYTEEAHWFLSKAYLKKRDFRSARAELQTVRSLQGAHASAAQDLLQQITNF